LLKEYRRDIKRFLRKERDTYPTMPGGYFDVAAERVLDEFQDAALSQRREEMMEKFPEFAVAGSLQNTWHSSAVRIYRNWMQYVMSRKVEVPALRAVASVYQQLSRKRTVLR